MQKREQDFQVQNIHASSISPAAMNARPTKNASHFCARVIRGRPCV
jgi:hypothetical protein